MVDCAVDDAILEFAGVRDAAVELEALDAVARMFQPTTAMAPIVELSSSVVVASSHAVESPSGVDMYVKVAPDLI